MAALTKERRDLVANSDGYLKWFIHKYASKALVRTAVARLGDIRDVYQLLACELCRILASMVESPRKNKIPSFVAEQLATKLVLEVNLIRNKTQPQSLDAYLLHDTEQTCIALSEDDYYTVEVKDVAKKIKELINQASEDTRDMILRNVLEGESFPSIAKDYNITPTAVRIRVVGWLRLVKENCMKGQ